MGDQADEEEALSAIYGDDFTELNPSLDYIATWEITIAPNVKLHINIPSNYPSVERPHCKIISDVFSTTVSKLLLEEVVMECGIPLGEVCIFQYTEALRQRVSGLLVTTPPEPEKLESPKISKKTPKMEEAIDYEDPFYHSETITDRKSVFQVHSAIMHTESDANIALEYLINSSRKISSATHNIVAWRIAGNEHKEDDGESGAGQRMLHVLRAMDAMDIMVCVSRWYGGVKLGPDRFKHIMALTRIGVESLISDDGKVKIKTKGKKKKGKRK